MKVAFILNVSCLCALLFAAKADGGAECNGQVPFPQRSDGAMSFRSSRRLSSYAIIESSCDATITDGENLFLNQSCCNEINCNGDTVVCNSNQACLSVYESGASTHCTCDCGPGFHPYSTPEHHKCCYGQCNEDQSCYVSPDFSWFDCYDSALIATTYLPFTDGHITSESKCTFPYTFDDSTGKCARSAGWKMVGAMVGLAALHFNTKDTRFIPAIADAITCTTNLTVKKKFIDTKSGYKMLDSLWYDSGYWDTHFGVGPEALGPLQTATFVAYAYLPAKLISSLTALPNAYGNKDKYPGLAQSLPSASGTVTALCQHLDSYSYTVSSVLYEQGIDEGYIVDLQAACEVYGIQLQLYPYLNENADPGESDYMRDILTTINSTDVNIVIYLGEAETPNVPKLLQLAYDINLLREGSMWIFSDSRIIESFSYMPAEIQRALNGSFGVHYRVGDRSHPYLKTFLESWKSFDVAAVNKVLPSTFQLPADFFEVTDPFNDEFLLQFGTLVYDVITAHALLSCSINPNRGYISSAYQMMGVISWYFPFMVNFEGLTGMVQYDDQKVRKQSTIRIELVNFVEQDGKFRGKHISWFDWMSNVFRKSEEEKLYNGGVSDPPHNFVVPERQENELRIGVLHRFTNRDLECEGKLDDTKPCPDTDSFDFLSTVLLATHFFNTRREDFGIPTQCNKNLSLFIYDTENEEGTTFDNIMSLIKNDQVDVLVGPLNTGYTKTTSIISSAFKVPQISYAARSNILDSDIYTHFMRVVPDFEFTASSVCAFWRHQGYHVAGILIPEGAHGESAKKTMTKHCSSDVEEDHIRVYAFSFDPTSSKTTNVEAIESLQKTRLNVVLYVGSGENTLKERDVFYDLIGTAIETETLSSSTTWHFVDWYIKDWFNFAPAEYKWLLSGSFFFDIKVRKSDLYSQMTAEWHSYNTTSLADMYVHSWTPLDPSQTEKEKSASIDTFLASKKFDQVAVFLHDAILSAGLIGCAATKNEAVNSSFPSLFWNEVASAFGVGISGKLDFDSLGNRIHNTVDMSIVNVVLEGTEEFKSTESWAYTSVAKEFQPRTAAVYNGGNSNVPKDVPERKISSLKIGLLQRITDSSILYEEDCLLPNQWIENACYLSSKWKGVAAMGVLAVKHFNTRDDSFVDEFSGLGNCEKMIELKVYDSGSSSVASIQAMSEMKEDGIDVVIGPFSDELTVVSAMIAGKYDLPQISYGATTSLLDNKALYPYLMRTVGSDDTRSSAICAFWAEKGFRFAAVIHSDDDYGRSFNEAVSKNCGNITIQSVEITDSDPNLRLKIETLAESKLNVVLCASKSLAIVSELVVQAYESKILRTGKSWFFSDESVFAVYSQIKNPDIQGALDGSIVATPVVTVRDDPRFTRFVHSWSELDLEENAVALPEPFRPTGNFFEATDPLSPLISQVGVLEYDAVSAAGLLACKAAGTTPINATFPEDFFGAKEGFVMHGLTGTLAFTATGNRDESTGHYEMKNLRAVSPTEYHLQVFAAYSIQEGQFNSACEVCESVVYNGGNGTLPFDVDPPVENMHYDPGVKPLVYTMFIINCIVAIGFMVWSFLNREHPIVKAAQTNFLYMISMGAIVSSLTLIPLTYDDSSGKRATELGVENSHANSGCMAQAWLYCIGFMLTFTPLFAKLRRVYKIFEEVSYANTRLTDLSMFLSILKLIAVDVIILLAWTLISPLRYVRRTEYNEYGYAVSSYGTCRGDYAWTFIAFIGIYHASVLFYGAYIAYQCSDVNSAFAESQYIAIAIYSALQVFLLGIPLLVVVADDSIAALYLRAGIIFLNDFSVQMVIFVPKVYYFLYGITSEGVGGDLISTKSKQTAKTTASSRIAGARSKSSRIAPSSGLASSSSNG